MTFQEFNSFAQFVITRYWGFNETTPMNEIRDEAQIVWDSWTTSEGTGDDAEDRFEQDIAYEAYDIIQKIDFH